VKFTNDCIGQDAINLSTEMKPGDILLLENLRFYKEETKGDLAFAEKLAKLGDIYVNDAFGTAHRAHASTAIIADFFPENKVTGYIMLNEVKNIEAVMSNAKRPFTAILGGAKVSGKVEVINSLLHKVDNLIIGGGMTFTFIKALGGNIGNSLVEDELLELAKNTIEGAKMMGVKLYLPADAVIADKFANDAQTLTSNADDIPEEWMGLDIGPETIDKYVEVIRDSKTILWNGPMGVFEMSNFENGKYYNRLVWMQADGNFSYSNKRHLFTMGDEHTVYHSGNKKIIPELKGWKILPLICYDLRFPVWSKNTYNNSRYEYDLLIYVANWPKPRNHVWKALLKARALENLSYVIGVNRIGIDGRNLEYSGDSSIINFLGTPLIECNPGEEETITYILNYEELQQFRNNFNVGDDWDNFKIKT
jgi:predicted amidohydrolase